ncbi:MAG TPA: DnaA N-terminal domain-containing protein, partial [Anaerolineae bacterium]|nr:DnaA N-terminal domain-containing protein [Anaerolineae bacterium]
MPGQDKLLHLQGVYNTLYNATTRPDFRFVVSRYFIDEWVPLLGPSLAWLIVGLRQQCFWNRRRDWCILDKATLARETALDERTIERCFKKPFSNWFLVDISHRYQYRTQLGKKVRDKNRYQLLLDEPLSPRHQIGLAALLRQLTPAQTEPLAAALAALDALLVLPHLTDKIAYTGPVTHPIQRRTVMEVVADTLGINLADSAGDERIILLDQRCSELYNLIVQPNKIYVGWQYFRLEWVRLLGHALAWVIIYLRRHCFWDEAAGELRDTLTLYKKDLATAINQTPRNLANLMDHPHASLFFTVAHPIDPSEEPAASRKEPRNKPTVYRVRMVDEPLTPGDQQQVAITLRQRLQDEFYGQNPENGQLNLFPMLDRLSNRQNFAYGQIPEKMPDNYQKERRLEATLPEKIPQYATPVIGKNAATLKDSLLIPSEIEEIKKQQIPPAVAIKPSKVALMLDDLSVQEPARSKLLANPDLTVVKIGAWFLYAETQPNLTDPHSYVIKRLLLNDPPPQEFLAFASLDDLAWSLFETTAQMLRMGQTPAKPIPSALLDIFVSWAEIYAGLEPAETKYLLSLTKSEDVAAESLPPVVNQSPQLSDPEPDLAHDLWRAVLAQLQLQMTRQTFDTWLKPTEVLDYHEGVFVIDAKSAFAKDWLE